MIIARQRQMRSGGTLEIGSGETLSDFHVNRSVTLEISSGGNVSGAFVSGGAIFELAGGNAASSTLFSGAILAIGSGAVLGGFTVSRGITEKVRFGGTSISETLRSGGTAIWPYALEDRNSLCFQPTRFSTCPQKGEPLFLLSFPTLAEITFRLLKSLANFVRIRPAGLARYHDRVRVASAIEDGFQNGHPFLFL
jgi:hypothetical protein